MDTMIWAKGETGFRQCGREVIKLLKMGLRGSNRYIARVFLPELGLSLGNRFKTAILNYRQTGSYIG